MFDIQVATKERYGNDAYFNFVDSEGRYVIAGVFDGVGSGESGGEAARIARDTLKEWSRYGRPMTAQQLKGCLATASTRIAESGNGSTTATIACIVRDDDDCVTLNWASVGDSRVFAVVDGQYCQVSKDECHPERRHEIENWLGGGGCKIIQHGSDSIPTGTRIVLVTDGVTGDYDPDILSVNELGEATMSRKPAQALIDTSRKRDDGVAVVVTIGEPAAGNTKRLSRDSIKAKAAMLVAAAMVIVSFACYGVANLFWNITNSILEDVRNAAPVVEVVNTGSRLPDSARYSETVDVYLVDQISITAGASNYIGGMSYLSFSLRPFVGSPATRLVSSNTETVVMDNGPYEVLFIESNRGDSRTGPIQWIGIRGEDLFAATGEDLRSTGYSQLDGWATDEFPWIWKEVNYVNTSDPVRTDEIVYAFK